MEEEELEVKGGLKEARLKRKRLKGRRGEGGGGERVSQV